MPVFQAGQLPEQHVAHAPGRAGEVQVRGHRRARVGRVREAQLLRQRAQLLRALPTRQRVPMGLRAADERWLGQGQGQRAGHVASHAGRLRVHQAPLHAHSLTALISLSCSARVLGVPPAFMRHSCSFSEPYFTCDL